MAHATQCSLHTIYNSLDMEKNHKCPSIEETIKKLQYIYTMEYYSAIKMNEIGSFVVMWMDLEIITQAEVSQKEKNINACMWNLVNHYR